MTSNVDNLVLEHLKALRNELKDFRRLHEEDISDLKHRITSLDRSMATIKRDAVGVFEDQSRQQAGLDRLAERLDRIERRLEIQV
jgi:hypothetical protein